MPEISVIVPVYNVEKYIHRCVDSILAQTFTDFELILVDDGSPDNCGAICDEYAAKDSRIKVFHQENKGQGAARNLALDWICANSSSKYVTFIDSDDWVHPQYLRALIEALIQTKLCVSACGFQRVKGLTDVIVPAEPFTREIISGDELYTNDGRSISAYICARMYKKAEWQNLRFPEGKKWEDLAVSYQLFLNQERIAAIVEPLYYYFHNPESTVNKKWSRQRMDFIWALEVLLSDPLIQSRPNVVSIVKRTYVNALAAEIGKIDAANGSVLNAEAKECKAALRAKLRNVIGPYSCRKVISFKSDKWIYQEAFPVAMQVYWLGRVVLRKLGVEKKQ